MNTDHRLPPLPDGSRTTDAPVPRRGRTPTLDRAGLALLREHLARAVPQIESDASARLVVEDIVSQLGARLGFTVKRDATEGVDAWASPSGAVLVVRASAAAGVAGHLRVLTQARDRLLVARGEPARRVSALAVVCGSLVNWRQIEEAAAVRRLGDHVRVISLDALLSLVELRGDQALAHTDALTLLRPQGVRADALVEILRRGGRRDAGARQADATAAHAVSLRAVPAEPRRGWGDDASASAPVARRNQADA